MIDATIDNRMARYKENQLKRGFQQIKLWVPAGDTGRFKKMAEMARIKHVNG